ncbi:MAG: RnfABCDGE type electron transport complex subunit D [Chromatiales bacterium]|nr:RnfABCDGE type electron transport complex subunit D [Chromatiales bacterium]
MLSISRERVPLGIFVVMPNRAMGELLVSLMPGIIALCYVWGWGVIINIVVAVISAIASEALILRIRNIPPLPVLQDYSAVVAAVLLAVAFPPYLPWWIVSIASACAIVIAKQLYGGLGNNLFNPAMVGYAIAIVAYPLHLTVWPSDLLMTMRFDWQQAIDYAIHGANESYIATLTGATPLDSWRTDNAWQPHAETPLIHSNIINIAFATGGLWLLLRRLIQWYAPVAMLCALTTAAAVFPGHLPPLSSMWLHLGCGATMLGAFYIATDPVTSPRHPYMKLLFGAGVGILVFIIRQGGSYADGLAFAILLMNLFVPLMDRYAK